MSPPRGKAIWYFGPHDLVGSAKKSSKMATAVFQDHLPDDAEIYGMGYCVQRDQMFVILRSAEYPVTPEGKLLPEVVQPVFKHIPV